MSITVVAFKWQKLQRPGQGSLSRWSVSAVVLTIVCWIGGIAGAMAEDFEPPKQIKVLPVFLVPQGAKSPTQPERERLMQHVQWTQRWYRKALKGRDTFEIARTKPEVVALPKPLAFYRDASNGDKAVLWTAHLLDHFQVSRFRCEWIFCCVIMNPLDDWPAGGAGPINGGVNRGGGYVEMSSYNLDRAANFQGALRHELGHAFGLRHVDRYGYDQKSGVSMMSYNPAHRTHGMTESKTPPGMISEDVRGLALNQLAFPKLAFDASSDVPAGYRLQRVIPFPPMILPGHPNYEPTLSTTSGEDNGSKVGNIFTEVIPNEGHGVTFHASRMWLSLPPGEGKVTLDVAFPGAVKLAALTVHSQHSGRWNAATGIQVAVRADGSDQWREVASVPQASPSQRVQFPPSESLNWRLTFQAAKLKNEWQKVCLRGLQFFSGAEGDIELFPPRAPLDWHKKLGVAQPSASEKANPPDE